MGAARGSSATDQILEAVVHEMRSVLNVVLTWTHMLSSGHLDASSSERGIESIRRSAEHHVQLLSDALDLSQIMAGTLALEVHPVSVEPLVAAALDSIRSFAAHNEVRVAAT